MPFDAVGAGLASAGAGVCLTGYGWRAVARYADDGLYAVGRVGGVARLAEFASLDDGASSIWPTDTKLADTWRDSSTRQVAGGDFHGIQHGANLPGLDGFVDQMGAASFSGGRRAMAVDSA